MFRSNLTELNFFLRNVQVKKKTTKEEEEDKEENVNRKVFFEYEQHFEQFVIFYKCPLNEFFKQKLFFHFISKIDVVYTTCNIRVIRLWFSMTQSSSRPSSSKLN